MKIAKTIPNKQIACCAVWVNDNTNHYMNRGLNINKKEGLIFAGDNDYLVAKRNAEFTFGNIKGSLEYGYLICDNGSYIFMNQKELKEHISEFPKQIRAGVTTDTIQPSDIKFEPVLSKHTFSVFDNISWDYILTLIHKEHICV